MNKIQSIKRKLVKSHPVFARIQLFLYRFKPYASKFQSYYLYNGWNNPESLSGPGSTLKATQNLRTALPIIFREYQIRSLTDIPCGDFHWMKEVDLTNVAYQGFDIVRDLAVENQKQYGRPNIRFGYMDLLKDLLPKADLVFCRDCLFHYSNRNIQRAIKNIQRSGSIYLFTTTFANLKRNDEIISDGLFRPINLQLPPFCLPTPLLIVNEEPDSKECKSMGLWRIASL